MNGSYEEFAGGSQSAFSVGRSAHPGAVLLSPQSSAMNLSNSVTSGGGMLSPQLTTHSHSLSFNEMIDQQSLLIDGNSRQQSQGKGQSQHQHMQDPKPILDQQSSTSSSHSAAGSAVLSPLVQSPSHTPASSSMFLDSFPRQSSNARSQSSHKSQNQTQLSSHKQSSQQHSQITDSNPVVNFTQDINQLCSWMSMLSSSQQNTVMDNLLSTLNEDVLRYTKLKFDSLMNSGYLSPKIPAIASPIPNRENYTITNLDSVFSNGKTDCRDIDKSNMDSMLNTSIIYQQWSPPPTSVTKPIYDYINDMHQRPKSADPSVSRSSPGQKGKRPTGTGSVNPHTSHNYTAHHTHYSSSKIRTAVNEYDSNNVNDNFNNGGHNFYNMRQSGTYNNSNGNSYNHGIISNQIHSQNNNQGSNNITSRSEESSPVSSMNPSLNHNSSNHNASGTISTGSTPVSNSGTSNGSSMNPKTLTDPRLLTNIPVWLKSLRLHKYSEALGSKKWDEMIYLDDETLEKIGISALGARRKLLKAFAIVQEYKEQDLIDPSAYV